MTRPGQSTERLEVLVTLLAYMAEADDRVPVAQRASFVMLLNKHVQRHDITENQVHDLMHAAFKRVKETPLEVYLMKARNQLTHGQCVAIVANLCDMMMVDGRRTKEEQAVIDRARRTLDVDAGIVDHLLEVFELKNDTAVFLDPAHPCNDPDFELTVPARGGATSPAAPTPGPGTESPEEG